MKKTILFMLLTMLIAHPSAAAAEGEPPPAASRFFVSGDGKVSLAGRGGTFSGTYRNADGTYNDTAMRRINALYGSQYGVPGHEITPRFVEFLDYLQDKLAPGKRITIRSGYRSPTYNTNLRENGKLAAKASLHQYAMAADVKFDGVSSERVWNFVKELGYGGAGFYHGGLVHVDVGPARSWDETTSGVGTDISDENKLVDLMTDRDIYRPGDPIRLQFTRMTAFPIGVARQFELVPAGEGASKKAIPFETSLSADCNCTCPKFTAIEQLANAAAALPADLPPGRYRVRASFCDKAWASQPDAIETREIEVRR